MTYAITRRRDPTTGEVQMTANEWSRSPAPMSEVVAMTLRTQIGACLVDPGLGVDWAKLSKLGTGATATARTTIEAALTRYVRSGQIIGLVVSTAVVGDRMTYEVSYRDPRATTANRTRITGAL